jgi:hypothetical protein
MGVSVYDGLAQPMGPDIESAQVVETRERMGGQLQMLPTSQTRWLMADLEAATMQADRGDMTLIGRLSRSMRRDGEISGLLKTRTSGLIALPKRFRGNGEMIELLQAENSSRSMFDEMLPPGELAAFTGDLVKLGLAVGELVPVQGRKFPLFIRLEPEYLRYIPIEGRWYYNSVAGMLPIQPGDGRWVMATAGKLNPWQLGDWHSLGRAFIVKEHAMLARSNFSRALANPARVAKTMKGSSETERAEVVQKLLAWGYNTTIALPEGWDADILETTGRGWEVFDKEIESANNEIMIALAGQIVTTTGGSGFANADIHRTIRADLIRETADIISHCINTQVFPPWAVALFGARAYDDLVRVSWDTAPPADRVVEAESLSKAAGAIVSLTEAVTAAGYELDTEEILRRFGVPLTGKKIAPKEGHILSTPDVKVEPPPAEPADSAADNNAAMAAADSVAPAPSALD